jgi:hypothetical protein
LFDDLGVLVYQWRRGQLDLEREFSRDDQDPASLLKFLSERHNDIFYILADLADEAFQWETVPHVRGSDRHNLLDRKLSQCFRGVPLRTAISLGRVTDGRRDEQLLLCALSAHAQFEPWLKALRQADGRLVGVFSLATVIASAASKLVSQNGPALIVCVTRSGVRHTFLDLGQLRFSRKAPLPSASNDALASVVATESARTYNYLLGQRLLDSESPMPMLVLAHPAHFEAILAKLSSSSASPVRCIDLISFAKACRLANKLVDSNSLELWLHLLIRRPPRDQFASCDDRRRYRLGKFRLGLAATAIVILAVCLTVAGTSLLQAQQNSQDAEKLASTLVLNERELQRQLATLPSSPIGTERLQALALRSNTMARRGNVPEQLLRRLADSLTEVPEIQLGQLTWRLGGTLNAATGDGKLPPSEHGYVIIEAQATLPPQFATDDRGLRSVTDRLRAAIASKDGVAAGTTDPRTTVDSTRTLRGGTQSEPAESLHFGFWLAQAL